MRSDNLQFPSVQPPNSSYNLQLPHGCHGHGNPGGHAGPGGPGGPGDMVVMVVMVVGTGQDRTRAA